MIIRACVLFYLKSSDRIVLPGLHYFVLSLNHCLLVLKLSFYMLE